NNTASTYAGTVHIATSDPQAVTPANNTLAGGIGIFSATLKTAGLQKVSANDTVTPSISGISNAITVSAAAATQFTVTAPSTATANIPFRFTVTALDQFNNLATNYAGTVAFDATDESSTLPPNTTLNGGVGTFNATLNASGIQVISATDTVTFTIAGLSNNI